VKMAGINGWKKIQDKPDIVYRTKNAVRPRDIFIRHYKSVRKYMVRIRDLNFRLGSRIE